jgi:formylglycine-generating enzyme required for sulfatase activity
MTQPILQRPSPREADYKARFGLDPQAGDGSRPKLQLRVKPVPTKRPPPPARPRYAGRALGLSLLMGTIGAAAFFIGQDYKGFLRLVTPQPNQQQIAVKQPGQAPATVSQLPKTTDEESPVLLPEAEPPQPMAELDVAAPAPVVKPIAPKPQATKPLIVSEAVPVAIEPAGAETPITTETLVETVEQTAVETSSAIAPEAVPAAVVPVQQPAPQPVQQAAVIAPTPEQVAPAADTAFPHVPGQVFRDCPNCPELVVVVPPRPVSEGVSVIQPGELQNLPPFALGRLEITFDDWALCVSNGGCKEIPSDNGWGGNTRPVINVSFDVISEQYLAWLSRATGATYRLPTTAEWEFAASGIAVSPTRVTGNSNPGEVCQMANFADAAPAAGELACADGYASTAPAGSLQPNALGLHDMRGNVWEWTSDCWTPGFTYKAKASEMDCRRRMLRGGSWSSRAVAATAPLNGWEDASRSKNAIGFRVLRTLP